jgi:hypothetical protein
MVRGQKISRTKLSTATPEERDALLKGAYGFTNEELDRIRHIQDIEERIKTAAKALFEKSNKPIAITSHNIAAVASEKWNSTTVRKYGTIISNMYKDRKKEAKTKGLNLPCTHFLREDIGAYTGNLEEAANVWKNFRIGPSDTLRSIKIPTNLYERDVSQLLGLYWADGYMRKTYGTGSFSFNMTFPDEDKPLYEHIVIPLIERIHNLSVPIETEEHSNENFSGKIREYLRYRVRIGSEAITSWLIKDLGYPIKRENIPLPAVDYDKKGFFEGIVAGMGRRYTHDYWDRMVIYDNDKSFIENIYNLSRDLGYTPTEPKGREYHLKGKKCTSWRILFHADDVRQMNFINPRHII